MPPAVTTVTAAAPACPEAAAVTVATAAATVAPAGQSIGQGAGTRSDDGGGGSCRSSRSPMQLLQLRHQLTAYASFGI